MDERGRHDEKIPRDRQIQRGHQAHIFKVLLRDQRDRNVVDIDLVFFDQMKKEVKRPFKLIVLM